MTSHDREFMNRIVTKIIEIDAGNADQPIPAITNSTSSSARLPE
jgi:ATPase subunit of ABC transporter with duplicated ATPase domains